ncbi:hypothetical protein ACH4YO_07855 [Streptomyces noursei]|uniref:hypothetical protein n=1 Tax=Streptomyces noursei TaxID=1971 RepID=UPI0033F063B5
MSFNNAIPGWVAARMAEIKTERTLLHQSAVAGPREDPDGNPTVLLTGTHFEECCEKTGKVTSSHSNTLHLTFEAAVLLRAHLDEAIKTHRIYKEFKRA